MSAVQAAANDSGVSLSAWTPREKVPEKYYARVPMKLDKLAYAVDQLTWTFVDMKNDGGRIALLWGNTMATTPFTAVK